MVKINRDKVRINVFIDMLQNKEITFSDLDRKWKEKVKKELKNRHLEHLAE